jgi:hypothetical protein
MLLQDASHVLSQPIRTNREKGRGFAVVAAEVRNLARPTGNRFDRLAKCPVSPTAFTDLPHSPHLGLRRGPHGFTMLRVYWSERDRLRSRMTDSSKALDLICNPL